MRKAKRNRKIIAWVLLLSLLPIFVVKTIHFHDVDDAMLYNHHAAGDLQAGVNGDACAICHFFLSPFVETETAGLPLAVEFVSVLIICVCADVVCRNASVKRLRAPPSYFVS
jgi:hypothetical protein